MVHTDGLAEKVQEEYYGMPATMAVVAVAVLLSPR